MDLIKTLNEHHNKGEDIADTAIRLIDTENGIRNFFHTYVILLGQQKQVQEDNIDAFSFGAGNLVSKLAYAPNPTRELWYRAVPEIRVCAYNTYD